MATAQKALTDIVSATPQRVPTAKEMLLIGGTALAITLGPVYGAAAFMDWHIEQLKQEYSAKASQCNTLTPAQANTCTDTLRHEHKYRVLFQRRRSEY